MFLLRKPSAEEIKRFIHSQRETPFSYSEVGATQRELPIGFTIDHNRRRLGFGFPVFEAATAALKNWKQFDLGWVQMVPPGTPIEVGAVVAILTRHFGFWSLNACRVIYLINENGPLRQFGFAYGTLVDHVERGEERFTIEFHEDDDSVWYDILAFSLPAKFIVKLGLPVARMLQKRFARDSMAVMGSVVLR